MSDASRARLRKVWTLTRRHLLHRSISYGDGSMASGDVYTDVITLGDIVIPNQDVELASKLSASFLQSGSDGLLGLAWPSVRLLTRRVTRFNTYSLLSQINTVAKNGESAPVATPVANVRCFPAGLTDTVLIPASIQMISGKLITNPVFTVKLTKGGAGGFVRRTARRPQRTFAHLAPPVHVRRD